MVKGKGKNARQTRNLLLKMSSDKLDGPLNILKDWKVHRKRVKVRKCQRTRSVVQEIIGQTLQSISSFSQSYFTCRYPLETILH